MQYVIITGEKRTGTTFLANLLNSQKEIVLYADFLVHSLFKNAKSLGVNNINSKLTAREKNIIISSTIAEGWQNYLELEFLKNQTELSLYEIFCLVMDYISNKKGDLVKVAGIKATMQINWVPEYLRNNIKVIYVIRDPRDVLISAKHRFSGFDLYSYATGLLSRLNEIETYSKNENFKVIKFEDLIINTNETIKSLVHFLGLKNFDIHLDKLIQRNGIKFTNNSSFDDINDLFDQKAVSRWKKFLEADEVIFASIFLKKYLDFFHYNNDLNIKNTEIKRVQKKYYKYKKRKKYQYLIRLYNKLFLSN